MTSALWKTTTSSKESAQTIQPFIPSEIRDECRAVVAFFICHKNRQRFSSG
jgi:hypothetical protein